MTKIATLNFRSEFDENQIRLKTISLNFSLQLE